MAIQDTINTAVSLVNTPPPNSSPLGLKEWLEIISILLSPIIAVIVGQYLQNRKQKYNAKLNVFVSIMGERHLKGNSPYFTNAINQTIVVYADNKKVISTLNNFITEHKKTGENFNGQDCLLRLHDLLIEMAKDLDYKDLKGSDFENFFYVYPSEPDIPNT